LDEDLVPNEGTNQCIRRARQSIALYSVLMFDRCMISLASTKFHEKRHSLSPFSNHYLNYQTNDSTKIV